MRSKIARLALLAATLVSLALPAFASATASPTEISTALGKGVTYLKGLQAESGEIPGFGGDWSLTALAAANTAPADVNKSGKAGKDARSWYEGVVGVPTWPGEGAVATDYERGALLAYAAGIDPARVSKRQNLIAKVASTYQPEKPGYYGSTLNGTVFGLLVLALIGAVFAELLSSRNGLGHVIAASASNFNVAMMFACAILLALIGIGLTQIIRQARRRLAFWEVRTDRTASVIR